MEVFLLLYPYKMLPVYKDYIWGGRNLSKLGKAVPQGKIAESWELSAIPGSESKIANGPLKGQNISDVIKKYGEQAIGRKVAANAPNTALPILLKFIDANDRLSVQVHPDNAYARQHENSPGKTEMWYVIEAEPSASVIHGFSEGLSREEIRGSILNNRHEGLYREIGVKKGDVVFIPAGTVHALNGGAVVAEIQQHSDITYRIYDYDRTDSSGNKRPLHVSKALDVLDFENYQPLYRGLDVCHNKIKFKYLAISKYFCARLVDGAGALEFVANGTFSAFMFIRGGATVESDAESVRAGALETVFIPAYMGRYRIEGDFSAIQVFVPDSVADIYASLREQGYSREDIIKNVAGTGNIASLLKAG